MKDSSTNSAPMQQSLVLAVESLAKIQDRYEAEASDGGSTGRSDNNDGQNIPRE